MSHKVALLVKAFPTSWTVKADSLMQTLHVAQHTETFGKPFTTDTAYVLQWFIGHTAQPRLHVASTMGSETVNKYHVGWCQGELEEYSYRPLLRFIYHTQHKDKKHTHFCA